MVDTFQGFSVALSQFNFLGMGGSILIAIIITALCMALYKRNGDRAISALILIAGFFATGYMTGVYYILIAFLLIIYIAIHELKGDVD